MIHDPNRKNDDNEDDRQGREKNEKVPTGTLFSPDIEETDRLSDKLENCQHQKEDDVPFFLEVKKVGVGEDQEGCEGQNQRGDISDDPAC